MSKSLIHRLLKELDRGLARLAEIILTGAAAGACLGVIRPSPDIDFEIRVKSRSPAPKPFDIGVQKSRVFCPGKFPAECEPFGEALREAGVGQGIDPAEGIALFEKSAGIQ